MATVVGQSELVRKALAWLDEQRNRGKSCLALLDEAGMRFNLSPNDQEFLKKFVETHSREK